MSAVTLRAVGLLLAVLYSVTGAVADKTVYSSVGSGVTLPCTQVPHANCSSTTWLYSEDFRTTRTVFEDGTMKLRKERLSVDSACSLRIANVSVEDRGKYTCRKFVNGERRGADTRVLLCVLSVSRVARPSADKTLSALQCVLLPCGGPASCSGHNTMSLRWVDGTGTEIQNDLRYEEQKSSCNITLSVKQKRADSNGERTCQLVDGSEVKTSRSYPDDEGSGCHDEETTGIVTGVVTGVVSGVAVLAAVLVALVVVAMRCRRTASEQRESGKTTTPPSYEYETVGVSKGAVI
ncbi:uncharacterized protein LOC108936710 [Scleropages formosus]|uniref:uncharacterized protein LOC108936710 n=1 Tax=Scleropages formosus TaxID=113540 RepID=UPI0010FA6C93|nr:uncharacterized protein LOC108936710 [Scleropages formosus]